MCVHVHVFIYTNYAMDVAGLWASNCCYGKILADREISFRSIRSTPERVWARSPFHVRMLPEGFLKFFFLSERDTMGIVAKSTWYLGNYFLMVVLGFVNIAPQDRDLEWFEGWVQIWGLQDYFCNRGCSLKYF